MQKNERELMKHIIGVAAFIVIGYKITTLLADIPMWMWSIVTLVECGVLAYLGVRLCWGND